jgi:hypothetical protein
MFAAAALCAGCNPFADDTVLADFEITKADGGKKYSAGIGTRFNVALRECVGCAEVWTITRQDTAILRLEERYSRDRSCTNCVGGSVTRVLRFRCMQTGESPLEFGYFEDTLRVVVDIQ